MSKIYGYCRVSTKSQKLERQIDNISKAYPTAILFKEKFTGTKIDGREEFNKLLSKVKTGDTIVFDSVSRMSRSAEDGIKLYFELFEKGINLVFLKEGYIDTKIYETSIQQSIDKTGNDIADIYIEATNKVIRLLAEKQIEKAFEQSEKEVKDLQQRIKEGIANSPKTQGIEQGRKLTTKKSIEMKDRMKRHLKDFGGTDTDKQFMQENKISRNTFYKYKRELSKEV